MWVIPDFMKQKDFKQKFSGVNKDRLPWLKKKNYRICNKNEKPQSLAVNQIIKEVVSINCWQDSIEIVAA